MAIGADAAIEFFGADGDLTNTTSAVADGAFSAGTADLDQWTNTDDAMFATAILVATYTIAPTAGTTVELHYRLIDIDSTTDSPVPDANLDNVIGVFKLKSVTSLQAYPIQIRLPNRKSQQIYEFYIKNRGGQELPAGWKLIISPKAPGPHA